LEATTIFLPRTPAQGISAVSSSLESVGSLSAPWHRPLVRASGYLELGMLAEAEKSLEEISAEDQSQSEVLGVRLNVYMAAKKWQLAASIARRLLETERENVAVWVNLAYSVRRSESVEEAEAILLRARGVHPKDALIIYNLACYASAAGRTEEAKERLREALELDKGLHALAREDPDLRPLWNWIKLLELDE
jgi:tetratricopeptide (TPR) repeat protein